MIMYTSIKSAKHQSGRIFRLPLKPTVIPLFLLLLFIHSHAAALEVTERFGGSNATLDHTGLMRGVWFGTYSGDGHSDSKILYHYDSGGRRNAVYIDLTAIPPGTTIVKAVYVMPYDTEDYWAFRSNNFMDGLSMYKILDPSETGMWNPANIGTSYKDQGVPWSGESGTFFDCIAPTPAATVYSIERGRKQFYYFEITGLVQEWVNDPASNLGVTFDDHVPSDRMTDPDFRPYLEITYDKDGATHQAQPTNLDIFYRSGQTFITWTELPYTGSFFNMTYNVYRHTEPITSLNIGSATLIGQVNQESSRNVARTEGHQRADSSYTTLHNYVIHEGGTELSDDTGLFVYTCKTGGNFYYAVTSVMEGNENRGDFSQENTLTSPVAEAIATPAAIVQSSFTNNYGNLVQEMVHWADDTMSYKIGHGFNFMVNISDDYLEDPDSPVYLEIGLGGRSTRYYNTWVSNRSIYIRPDTYMPPTENMPYDGYTYDNLQTWWSGCSTNYKTQKKLSDGVFVPYTENRILYYIESVKGRYNIDDNRVYLRGGSMGGTGAMSLGLKHEEIFASISATVGCPNWRYNIHEVDENYQIVRAGWRANADLLWGPEEDNPLHQNTTPIWDWMNAGWYLLNHPERETPFLEMNNGKKDASVMHFPIPQFYNDIRESRHGFAARFYDGGHSGYGGPFTRRFGTIVKNESFPALKQVSIDDDPGGIHTPTGLALISDFTTSPVTFDGDPAGDINGYYDIEWSRRLLQFSDASDLDDMVDTTDRYELALRLEPNCPESTATADITPRRLQTFAILPGNTYHWQNRRNATAEVIQEGFITADQYGLVTVPAFVIEKENLGNKLILVSVSQAHFDYDTDNDVDGADLSTYIRNGSDFSDLLQFSREFGTEE